MSGRLVLEMEDGTQVQSNLFPDVDLSAPEALQRVVYVRNAGDTEVRKAAARVQGVGLVVKALDRTSGPRTELGTIQPGSRVPLTVYRPASPERGSKSVSIVLSGLAVT